MLKLPAGLSSDGVDAGWAGAWHLAGTRLAPAWHPLGTRLTPAWQVPEPRLGRARWVPGTRRVRAGYVPGTCRVRRGTAARSPPMPIAVATESQYHRRMVVDPPNRAAERRPLDRLPLTQLRRGDRAVMASADLSPEDRAMLHAMGLDERAEFTVCRAGRHGPCIIQLDATRLGLSPDLAAKILTRPCDCPDAGPCMGASDASDPGAPQGSPQTSPHANSTAPAATSPASAPTLPPNT